METKIWILTLILTLTICKPAMADDTTVMQCQLTNGRDVKVAWNGENLTYVYGKPGKPAELALPNNPNDFYTMTYGHPSFASGEGVYYRFTNGKYDYVTYFSESGQSTVSNLGIFKDKKLIKQIKCKDYFHTDLKNIYQPVSDKINTDESDAVQDWIVNEDDTTPPDPVAQNDEQPSQGIPVKVEIQDIPSDLKTQTSANHSVKRYVYVYSLVDNITINGISVDRGSCYAKDIKPVTIAFGKRWEQWFLIYSGVAYANAGWNWLETTQGSFGKCMWSEVLIKTNKGNFTFNFSR